MFPGAARAREHPIEQAELDANIVDILKAYPKRKAAKFQPVASRQEDTSEEEDYSTELYDPTRILIEVNSRGISFTTYLA